MQVYVATHTHRHGKDRWVFASESQVALLRTELAQKWWATEFPNDTPPEDLQKLTDDYWECMERREEYLAYDTMEVDGLPPAGKMKVWVLNSCVPDLYNPVFPSVFASEAAATDGFDKIMLDEWSAAQLEDDAGEPIDYPGNPYDALRIMDEKMPPSWGRWEMTTHEVDAPAYLDSISAAVTLVLDLSTSHVSEATAKMLDACEITATMKGEYGWLISTAESEERNADWPAELNACAAYGRSVGAAYLMFDSDGPTIDGLPTFDW